MLGKTFGIPALVAAMALAACSGGGSGAGGLYGGPPPTKPPSSNTPIQEMVAGRPGFVNPANHRTLYFLSSDTPAGGTCTGGCLSVWPPIAPSSGARAQNGFTIITRSDGTGKQWAHAGHPLYMFSGDTGPDQANGEGIPLAGGTWHVARP